MEEFYNTNEDFKEYVDRYCEMRGFTVQEALKHALIRVVYEHYKSLLG